MMKISDLYIGSRDMDNKGFTLIEVIISVAILGIITLMTLSLFSTTFLNIVRFGDLTEVVVENQETIEHFLSDETYVAPVPGQTVNAPPNSEMRFTLTIGGTGTSVITTTGNYYEVEKEDIILRMYVDK